MAAPGAYALRAERPAALLGLAVLALLLAFVYWDGIAFAAQVWFETPEYSHGVLIPFIAAYLVWRQRGALSTLDARASWAGPGLLLLALVLDFVGRLSTLYVLIHYSLILALAGIALAYWGWAGLRRLIMPLLFLLLMIPLPNILYKGLSSELQLLSSQFGVLLIRLFGITVYIEGNVIDLGQMKLQVVEACSGLRYLFPLMTVSFILAYIYKGPVWQRLLVFASSLPVTVLMNSLRIGVIGVTVEYWGEGMAEGVLHDFEGWLLFMASCAVLLGELALLARLRGLRLTQCLALDPPAPASGPAVPLTLRTPMLACGALIVAAAVAHGLAAARADVPPPRADFAQFPLELADWSGHQGRIDQAYVDVLKFDDYLMADYSHPALGAVNLYVAWYSTQRAGQSAHSPRTCIPGGGWEIESLDEHAVSGRGVPFVVNRVMIRKGEERQLVYYWFQQRGRQLRNEYLVKWYLLWDAITRHRTDGAMVRLITALPAGSDAAAGDARLDAFARAVEPRLHAYVPD